MKKILVLNILLVALVLFSSCKKDFLDRQPMDAYSNSSLWTSAADANAALTGVYNGQMDPYNAGNGTGGPGWASATWIVYFDCASDDGYSQYPWEGFQALGNGSNNPSTNDDGQWNNYTTIQKCNFFLANIDRVPINSTDFTVAVKNQMIAQVRFIRAYEYFMLSQLYGDVPLITTNITPEQANTVVSSPKDTVTHFILSELAAAAPDLPIKYSAADEGHITEGAALALKARVELFNQNYTDCIADCQAVMGLGCYSLYPSYTDLFRIQYQYDNPEIILAAQYVENPITSSNGALGVMPPYSVGGWASILPLQSLVDTYEMTNGKTITDPTSGYDPNNPYANRDPRLAATILYPGAPFKTSSGSYYDPMSKSSPDYFGNGLEASSGTYMVNKYTSHLSDFDNMWVTGLNMPVIRYAEVLLTDAEAKIESGKIDQSVYNDINLVRNRAGMPSVDQSVYNNQSTLDTLVRRERRVEFAFEGLRFFDIQRWKIGTQVMNGPVYGARVGTVNSVTGQYTPTGDNQLIETRVFTDKNYLLPIPQSEINLNKNLKQNPGY